jgi:hypothetical protein
MPRFTPIKPKPSVAAKSPITGGVATIQHGSNTPFSAAIAENLKPETQNAPAPWRRRAAARARWGLAT